MLCRISVVDWILCHNSLFPWHKAKIHVLAWPPCGNVYFPSPRHWLWLGYSFASMWCHSACDEGIDLKLACSVGLAFLDSSDVSWEESFPDNCDPFHFGPRGNTCEVNISSTRILSLKQSGSELRVYWEIHRWTPKLQAQECIFFFATKFVSFSCSKTVSYFNQGNI